MFGFLLIAALALRIPVGSAGGDVAHTTDTADLLKRVDELERKVAHLTQQDTKKPERPIDLVEEALPQKRFHDKVTAFFHACKVFGRDRIGPILLSDAMFYISIALVIQWHIRFHLHYFLYAKVFQQQGFRNRQVKPMMTLRRAGLNVLILGVYYDNNLPGTLDQLVKNRPFLCSIFIIFLDTVVLYYVFMVIGIKLDKMFDIKTQSDDDPYTDPLDEAEDDGNPRDKLQANNVYEDLTFKLRKVTPIYIVQLMLVILYIEELNSSNDTKHVENVDFNYWIIAVLFQISAGEGQVGEPFNPKYWRHILGERTMTEELKQHLLTNEASSSREPDDSKAVESMDREERSLWITRAFSELGETWHKVFWVVDMKFSHEWQIRRFMDWQINSVARNLILYTVPIMVCVEGPLDFVKDLTAVMFITMLDDLAGEPKDLEEVLVKMKYSLKSQEGAFMAWDFVSMVCGCRFVEAKTAPSEQIALNRVERNYIDGNSSKFERLETLDGKNWKNFRSSKRSAHSTRSFSVGSASSSESGSPAV